MAVMKNQTVQFVRNPALQQVELRFAHYRQPAFQKHTHDAYSIGVVRQGCTCFHHYNRGEQVQHISKGDIVLIDPGVVHACNPEPGSVLTYSMLYIDPALVQETAAALSCGGELPSFQAAVVRHAALGRAILRLCRALAGGANPLEMETRLQEMLAALLSQFGGRRAEVEPRSASFENVQPGYAYLMENLARNVSLQELAQRCGLSPYHFLRAFHCCYGLPPHTYQLQQRIVLAKHLLAQGVGIAQAAAEVGFADQSHFTRKFKALVGATPRQYQNS